jgi:type VI secretion system secreted protein Hcp
MKLGDIKGESTDTDHKDWIIIESMSQPIHRAGGTSSQPIFPDMTVAKSLDKSTPKLMEAVAKGRHFPDATIEFTRTLDNGQQQPYLQYKLSDVLVSSYQHSANSEPPAGSPPPTDSFSLNFEEIKITYGGVRQTYFRYDANDQLVETVSEGTITRVGGTVPPPDVPPTPVTDSISITGPAEEATTTAE